MNYKKVYLSPSVQENNIGVGNYGTEEKRMNEITDIVEEKLLKRGMVVYRNDPFWNLNKIALDSNNKKPNIHVAIHSNANNKKSRGCEVFCHKFGGEGEKLSRLIYEGIAVLTPSSDRGVKEGFNFYGEGKHMYELAVTNCPATLIEVAFHDNKEDAKFILDNIKLIGESIA
jgi:N-acetylmuramoyl-L-alanine amidase